MEGKKLGLLGFCALVAMFPTLRAHIADFDEVWQQRAEEARRTPSKPTPEIPRMSPIILTGKSTSKTINFQFNDNCFMYGALYDIVDVCMESKTKWFSGN
jgi:hypothetical protein